MAKKTTKVNADPLVPSQTLGEWEAQGWASESVPMTAAPRLETTISIRFDPESATLLRRAARLQGLTKSQFVRQATLQEARKTIDEARLPASLWISERPKHEVVTTSSAVPERNLGSVTTTQASVELVPR
jgi:uncharacterized protein (DUF1778 family)